MSLETGFLHREIGANGRSQGCEEEFCDQDGAYRIKRTIEAYWAKLGHPVTVEVVNMGFSNACRQARFDVRSQMRNGLPPSLKIWSPRDKVLRRATNPFTEARNASCGATETPGVSVSRT